MSTMLLWNIVNNLRTVVRLVWKQFVVVQLVRQMLLLLLLQQLVMMCVSARARALYFSTHPIAVHFYTTCYCTFIKINKIKIFSFYQNKCRSSIIKIMRQYYNKSSTMQQQFVHVDFTYNPYISFWSTVNYTTERISICHFNSFKYHFQILCYSKIISFKWNVNFNTLHQIRIT